MSISSYTVVTMLDSRPSPITIPLPTTSDILNRIITFKDLYGSASTNTITLVTRNGDTFEDGTFSTIMSNTYQTLNFYAGQPGKWLNIDGGSGGGSSAGVTPVSNLLNSVSTNVTSISTNVATVSNRLNGVSTNATSISTNVATVSNLLNSVSTNATSISTNVATVSNTVAAGRFTGISTNTISTNLIIAGYVSSPQGYISSLIVDALSFSLSNSFISMGDIITTSVSTIQTFTSTLTTNNLRVGTVSTLNYIAFSGLQQGYNQTVIAEQSTGTGIQELLFFKGSTNTDRIRIQTTGPIVFEPGVSARVFPATGSNATPAMIITTGSNVGIGVAAPTVSLDLAGAGRFTAISTNTISTNTLTVSNINGIADLPIQAAAGCNVNLTALYINLIANNVQFSSNFAMNTGTTAATYNLTAANFTRTVSLSTNTISTNTISTGTMSANQYYGNGSLLTGITAGFVSTATSDLNMNGNYLKDLTDNLYLSSTSINLHTSSIQQYLNYVPVPQPVIQFGSWSADAADSEGIGGPYTVPITDYNNTNYCIYVTGKYTTISPVYTAVPVDGSSFNVYFANGDQIGSNIFYWQTMGYYGASAGPVQGSGGGGGGGHT